MNCNIIRTNNASIACELSETKLQIDKSLLKSENLNNEELEQELMKNCHSRVTRSLHAKSKSLYSSSINQNNYFNDLNDFNPTNSINKYFNHDQTKVH